MPRCTQGANYFIVTLAGAIAAGIFGGGGHGPDSTPTKAALSKIAARRAKLCWWSSVSAGVICLFISFSSSSSPLRGLHLGHSESRRGMTLGII